MKVQVRLREKRSEVSTIFVGLCAYYRKRASLERKFKWEQQELSLMFWKWLLDACKTKTRRSSLFTAALQPCDGNYEVYLTQ